MKVRIGMPRYESQDWDAKVGSQDWNAKVGNQDWDWRSMKSGYG